MLEFQQVNNIREIFLANTENYGVTVIGQKLWLIANQNKIRV